MNNERREPTKSETDSAPTQIIVKQHLITLQDLTPLQGASCELGAEGHCVTCSDEALQALVLRVDQENGLALVFVNDTTEEVDITLVEEVGPGDMLLVHGGVAIAQL